MVDARLKLVGGWMSARRMEGVSNALKVSELNNRVNLEVVGGVNLEVVGEPTLDFLKIPSF